MGQRLQAAQTGRASRFISCKIRWKAKAGSRRAVSARWRLLERRHAHCQRMMPQICTNPPAANGRGFCADRGRALGNFDGFENVMRSVPDSDKISVDYVPTPKGGQSRRIPPSEHGSVNDVSPWQCFMRSCRPKGNEEENIVVGQSSGAWRPKQKPLICSNRSSRPSAWSGHLRHSTRRTLTLNSSQINKI